MTLHERDDGRLGGRVIGQRGSLRAGWTRRWRPAAAMILCCAHYYRPVSARC
jgi:hypothetical protein